MSANGRNDLLNRTSFLQGANALFVEDMYARFLADPGSVDQSWAQFFAELDETETDARRGASWRRADWPPLANGENVATLTGDWPEEQAPIAAKIASGAPGATEAQLRAATLDSIRAIMMIRAYRIRGHLAADLDPLKLTPPTEHPELDPRTYGFTEADMNRKIFLDKVLGLEEATIPEILELLKRTYCSTFALEFMHLSDPAEKAWLQRRIEGPEKEISFTPQGRRAILNKLVEAEGFEHFLNLKFPGTKRFGLDGGESLIPALEQVIKRGGNLGVKEIVIGMPHRGRLNVLANVMQKAYRSIFHEFLGGNSVPDDVEVLGDVKYHLGASHDRSFDGNKVHLSLTANPSHLEAVNPVALGKARAKQMQLNDRQHAEVLPLLMHGDAAFAGQGVVAECFALSMLNGHRTGGTIHFIVNNQIGFTTSPINSRSSPYPSDVAKTVAAPIFHVNGDDPEAVVYAAKVATEFRQKFQRDVVVDMFCYRRFGHNEGDEPAFTQPKMVKRIKQHASTLTIYGERLAKEGVIEPDAIAAAQQEFKQKLESEFDAAPNARPNKADRLDDKWEGFELAPKDYRRGDTGVDEGLLRTVGAALVRQPENIAMHRTLLRLLKNKAQMFETGAGFDWATAEALAFGSLLVEGLPVRLSGQDSTRGTFSQRHSAFIDQETEERYYPLNNIQDGQAHFEVIDSALSEFAVLGFEYGYSLSEPNTLVLWEAQFGDFANGAQIMFDQFIATGESKWLRSSGLVVLLPHGYEGQGPEHSSARIERFLQLSADNNWQVANCTTPANYFHILRRQVRRPFRKPLILFTPKSLLRHKRAVSKLSEMTSGSTFHRILWDDADNRDNGLIKLKDDKKIRRVILCSGKVYYDLVDAREEAGVDDVQILRIEQLFPFDPTPLATELTRFPKADIVWCQEEPKNQGPWTYIEPLIEETLTEMGVKKTRARYVGRKASASTATGLATRHAEEQAALVREALTG